MTEYVPVSWSREPITVEKLQQMATNDQALFELKPTASINHNGVRRTKGMKILAGSQVFQPSNTFSTTKTIYFGNFFSAGCSPIVIPSIYSHPQMGMNLTPHAIGGGKLPDHRGFNVYVWADDRGGNSSTIVQPYYVTFIAMGF
jgi:hypothetical protein